MRNLSQANASKDAVLGIQSNRLQYASIFSVLLLMISAGLYRRSINRRKKAELLLAEKNELKHSSIEERRLLSEKSNKEKKGLVALAAAERNRLQEKQNELKERVNNIEQSNLELENQLAETRRLQAVDTITISTRTKVHKIKVDQLLYIAAEKDGTRIYLKDRNFYIILPLKLVMEQLPANKFIQIFRSTVVNANFISAVNSKYIVLENGEELVMSRTYRDGVKGMVE